MISLKICHARQKEDWDILCVIYYDNIKIFSGSLFSERLLD